MSNEWISIGTVVGKQVADNDVKERRLALYVKVINGEKFYAVRGNMGFYHHVKQVKYGPIGGATHSVCFDQNETGKEANEPWYFTI